MQNPLDMEEENQDVIIVEDDAIIAAHISKQLKSLGHHVVGIAHHSEVALDMIYARKPTFLILDINIEGSKDGIEVAKIVNEKYNIPFLFLTAYSDPETLSRARAVRPCGYIVKPFRPRDLASSIAIGLFNFTHRKANTSLDISKINHAIDEVLTTREFEVLSGIMQGLTNAQIADQHFVTLSTIKYHTRNIYAKLNVKNRTSAINKIIEM